MLSREALSQAAAEQAGADREAQFAALNGDTVDEELEALRSCARRHGAQEAADLKPWDVSYWAERLRQESFELDSEALRPYFPLDSVLQGLFSLCARLSKITIVADSGSAPLWPPYVQHFTVFLPPPPLT